MTWKHERILIRLREPQLSYARICSMCGSVRQCIITTRQTSWTNKEAVHLCAHCVHKLAGVFLPKARKATEPLILSTPTATPAKKPARRLQSKRKPHASKRRRLRG